MRWPWKKARPVPQALFVRMINDIEGPIVLCIEGLEANNYETIGAQLTPEQALALADQLASTVNEFRFMTGTKGIH